MKFLAKFLAYLLFPFAWLAHKRQVQALPEIAESGETQVVTSARYTMEVKNGYMIVTDHQHGVKFFCQEGYKYMWYDVTTGLCIKDSLFISELVQIAEEHNNKKHSQYEIERFKQATGLTEDSIQNVNLLTKS